MKVFPFALIRLAAMPFPKASAPLKVALTKVKEQEKTLEVTKATLLQELASIQTNCSNNFQKHVCLNLIRDLKQDRSIKLKAKFEFLLPAKQSLQNWNSAKATLHLAQESLGKSFDKSLMAFRADLKNHLKADAIQAGISMSSKSAWRNIAKFIETPDSTENKKLRQAELTGLKYYSRAATKTSPFAGFGPLAWVGNLIPKQTVKCKVNQVLLIYLEEYILSKSVLRSNLEYRINPSLWRIENEYNFLVNHRNVEEIKILEVQDLLEYMVDNLLNQSWTKVDWIKHLVATLEIAETAITPFIEGLVEASFFLPIFPCSREDSEWLTIWETFLKEKFSKNIALVELIEKTRGIKTWTDQEIKAIHQDWCEVIGPDFNLSEEKFFYRDDYVLDESVGINESYLESTFSKELKIINKYIPRLHGLFFSKQQEAIKVIFDRLKKEQIGLLDFYKIYHGAKPIDIESSIVKFENSIKEFDSNLAKIITTEIRNKITQEGVFNISIELLNRMLPVNCYNSELSWYGAILQTGEEIPFLRNVFIGHGKMMSRFIQDENIENAIQNWNAADVDFLYVDHADSSAFNANLHPTLTKKRIASVYPNSVRNTQEIKLNDLYITKENGELILRSKTEKQPVIPINYGLEGLDRRSPLYQLIQGFGTAVPDFNHLVKRLNKILIMDFSWGTFLPRIQLANQLVIQRKQWIIKKEYFALVNKKRENAEMFVVLHKLLDELKAPKIGFLRQKISLHSSRKNDHKPQFFNFSEPTFFLLLKRMLKSWKEDLIWEECYPRATRNAPFKSKAKEWIVEWKG